MTSLEHHAEPLYVMQLRCGERKLVVPRNVVVELKPFHDPEPLQHPQTQKLLRSNTPWLLGSVIYRELPLPLISLEKLIDNAETFERRRARICILHSLDHASAPNHYAIVCQSFPSLLEVPNQLAETVAEQTAPPNPDGDTPYIAGQLQLGGYLSAIPNLPAIEKVLVAALAKTHAI